MGMLRVESSVVRAGGLGATLEHEYKIKANAQTHNPKSTVDFKFNAIVSNN